MKLGGPNPAAALLKREVSAPLGPLAGRTWAHQAAFVLAHLAFAFFRVRPTLSAHFISMFWWRRPSQEKVREREEDVVRRMSALQASAAAAALESSPPGPEAATAAELREELSDLQRRLETLSSQHRHACGSRVPVLSVLGPGVGIARERGLLPQTSRALC